MDPNKIGQTGEPILSDIDRNWTDGRCYIDVYCHNQAEWRPRYGVTGSSVAGAKIGLCIALANESGENLAFITDDQNDSNPMLASIDWYRDTVFNAIQMRRFVPEWDRLKQRVVSTQEQQLVNAVEGLAQRCRDEVHLYLKFIGD